MDGAGGRSYEDFKPPHKMVREPPTHTLTIDLSAKGKALFRLQFFMSRYKKEHIKVQLVRSRQRLVVSGECPVAGETNRWSRFRLQFPVPDGCDLKAIQARLQDGVVRVTLPGVKPQQQPPPAKTAAGAAAGAVAAEDRRCKFLRERGKLATTLLGVVLVLFSFVIYIRYSVKP
uniref:SHSP domain-containing protein n=1 Tax=Oryza meridionalis TaxID=40149 RepID=A0A0E0DCI8_9ORYZ